MFTPLQLGAMVAPTAVNLTANLFRRNQPSPYEQQLSRMASLFESEAESPITENREFKSGMKLVDRSDEQNRRAINNQSATSGATDEAKIATMGSANETRDMNIDRLLNNARRYRSLMQNRALQTGGMLENARQNRNAQWQQGLQSITQPLGQASNAFIMSSLFGGGEDLTGQGGTPEIASAGGFLNATRNNAMNQALGQGMWG